MNDIRTRTPQLRIGGDYLPSALRPLLTILMILGVLAVIMVVVSQPGKSDVALAGIIALLGTAFVYARWGGYGLLIGYALTFWYPFTLYRLVGLLGVPLNASTAIVAVGSGILFLRFIGGLPGSTPVVVPAVVTVVATGAWTLTWFFSPPAQTVNYFLVVVAYVLILVVCLTLVRTARQARLLCWAATASGMVTYGAVAFGTYIAAIPFVSATGSAASTDLGGRLHGWLTLPGVLPVEVWGGRDTGVIAGAMIVPFVYLAAARTARERVVYGLPLLVLAVVEMSTRGRAGWVGLALGVVVVLLVGVRVRSWRFSRFMGALAGALVVAIATHVWLVTLGAGEILRADAILSPMSDGNMQARAVYWERAVTQILRHPGGIGFAAGQRQFQFIEHNVVLWLATGLGIMGAVAVVALWVWLGHRAVLASRSEDREVRLVGLCALGTLIVAIVAGMADNTPFLSPMFWLVWGAAAALSYRYTQGATKRSAPIGQVRAPGQDDP